MKKDKEIIKDFGEWYCPTKWDDVTLKMFQGETYMVNYQSKLKTGEYVATDAVIKSDAHNYAAILAILCRKENEAYDSKYENEVLPSRVEMWEKQPITKVMPIVNFFLNLFMTFAATPEKVEKINASYVNDFFQMLSYIIEEQQADEAEEKFQDTLRRAKKGGR